MTRGQLLDEIHKLVAEPMGQLARNIASKRAGNEDLQSLERGLARGLERLRSAMSAMGIPLE